jgi:Skp family chaperone for outer membrane proteins
MKVKRLLNLALALLALGTPALAQSNKVAIVDTSAFTHPEKGITRLVRARESVEQAFAPRWAELAGMYTRLQKELEKLSFAGPIPADPHPMSPERKAKIKEAADAIQRSIEQRQAAMQLAFTKRAREVSAPILQEIRNSLEAFARARGIAVLIDANKSACLVGCDGEEAVDITQEFVDDYNRQNP